MIKSTERHERIVNTKAIISSVIPPKNEEEKKQREERSEEATFEYIRKIRNRTDASNPVVERELVKRHFPRCKVPAISTGEMHPTDASVPRWQTQTTIDFELTRNLDAP